MDDTGATWRSRALCKGLDPDVFHPERGEQPTVTIGQHAVPVEQVCLACPVRLQCLDHAMGEMQGIWGAWPGEVRAWVRRKPGRECPACAAPIPRYTQLLFCGPRCSAAATAARGCERATIDSTLAGLQADAQLAIAQSKGRRVDRSWAQLTLFSGGVSLCGCPA